MRWLGLGIVLVAMAACGDDTGGGPTDGGGNGPDGMVQTGCEAVSGAPDLDLVSVGSGFTFPVFVTTPPGDDRLFVVEQNGTIAIMGGGTFLDISSRVDGVDSDGDESGLLGLAFHPDYQANGRLYVYYITTGGDVRIAEYTRVTGNPDAADPASEREIKLITHGGGHHYGGSLMFGPDGYLYAGTGDGGFGGCDPMEYGQDTGVLLGKILRLDPATGDGAPGNPFGDEIWHYGLRNPWRFSFDGAAGDLYIGDVGQGTWEEIDVVSSSETGLNFGWDIYEADLCHDGGTCMGDNVAGPCVMTGKTFPVLKYNDGAAVIGGYVYRGGALGGRNGTYFYGDYGQGWIRSFRSCGDGTIGDMHDWTSFPQLGNISSFGEGSDGELYVIEHDAGQIYKLVAR